MLLQKYTFPYEDSSMSLVFQTLWIILFFFIKMFLTFSQSVVSFEKSQPDEN